MVDSTTAIERGFPATTGKVIPGNKTTSRKGSKKLVSSLFCLFKNREVTYDISPPITIESKPFWAILLLAQTKKLEYVIK
jgi:hypothetical protein